MTKVKDIVHYFENLIPPEMKMDFDNVGLLVGTGEAEVTCALCALDISNQVIDEAIALDAKIILSHHPMFFELKSVNDNSITGQKVVKLLRNGISAFCQHTNLDAVDGGVNDALAKAIGVHTEGRLDEHTASNGKAYGIGRYGHLEKPMALEEYAATVKNALNANGIRYYDSGTPVYKVALCGGSGSEYIEKALTLGCDTLVTADVKYHQMLDARELGLNIIDADHFCTENVVVPVLAEILKKGFPDVEVVVSKTWSQTAQFC